MRTSTTVTNSRSQAEASAQTPPGLPNDNSSAPAKPRRTGSRRVSMAAGSPTTASPVLLVFGDDGLLVAAEPVAGPVPDSVPDTVLAEDTSAASATTDDDGTSNVPDSADASDVPNASDASDTSDTSDTAEAATTISATAAVEPTDATDTPGTAVAAAKEEADDSADAEPLPSKETAAEPVTAKAIAHDDQTAHDEAAPEKADRSAENGQLEPESSSAKTTDGAATTAEAAAAESLAGADSSDSEPPRTEAAPEAPAIDAVEPAQDEELAGGAPLSRRERRLAEQGLAAPAPQAVQAAPASPTPAAVPNTSTSQGASPEPRKRRSFWSILRGMLLLLVIAALILTLGTVVSGQDSRTAGPSSTEVARGESYKITADLLADLNVLQTRESNASVQAALTATSTALTAQLAALSDGRTATPTSSSSANPAPTLAQLSDGLANNANSLLQNSLTATGALGRLFASVGTNQFLQAQALLAAAGGPALPSPTLTDSTTAPSDPAVQCHSTLQPKPGITSDEALLRAVQGEQKAIYAYQVAAARLGQPQLSRIQKLLGSHQSQLAELTEELEVRCLPAPSVVPGFALDASFATAPSIALAALEGDLAKVYGDAAALSTPIPAAPSASATTAAAAPSDAATSNLRQLAVSGLLDSAQNQRLWGGQVAPLPGIAIPANAGS